VAVLAAAAAVAGGVLAATPDQTINAQADPDAAGQEQGRDHRPSEHVLEALARALRLDSA
jgi:hypothetical protein